jgi:hypothetical protein
MQHTLVASDENGAGIAGEKRGNRLKNRAISIVTEAVVGELEVDIDAHPGRRERGDDPFRAGEGGHQDARGVVGKRRQRLKTFEVEFDRYPPETGGAVLGWSPKKAMIGGRIQALKRRPQGPGRWGVGRNWRRPVVEKEGGAARGGPREGAVDNDWHLRRDGGKGGDARRCSIHIVPTAAQVALVVGQR